MSGVSYIEYHLLSNEIEAFYHEIAVKSGLSDSSYLVLYFINEFEGRCRQADISKASFTSKKTVHSAVQKLVAQGLIAQSEKEGRQRYLSFTQEGKRFVQQHFEPVYAAEQNAFDALSETEKRELMRINKKLFQGVQSRLKSEE